MKIRRKFYEYSSNDETSTKITERYDEKTFVGKSSIVEIEVKGDKTIKAVKINSESFDKDEIEMLEDMIVVALNDAMKQIDKETEEKMGKYTQGMPGLF